MNYTDFTTDLTTDLATEISFTSTVAPATEFTDIRSWLTNLVLQVCPFCKYLFFFLFNQHTHVTVVKNNVNKNIGYIYLIN